MTRKQPVIVKVRRGLNMPFLKAVFTKCKLYKKLVHKHDEPIYICSNNCF